MIIKKYKLKLTPTEEAAELLEVHILLEDYSAVGIDKVLSALEQASRRKTVVRIMHQMDPNNVLSAFQMLLKGQPHKFEGGLFTLANGSTVELVSVRETIGPKDNLRSQCSCCGHPGDDLAFAFYCSNNSCSNYREGT